MTHEPRSPEIEPGYNLTACYEAAKQAFRYTPYGCGGNWPDSQPFYLETKFIPETQVVDGRLSAPPVTERVPALLEAISPAKGQLEELYNTAQQERRLFAAYIVEATEATPDVFVDISAAEAVTRIGERENRRGEADKFLFRLRHRGWLAVPATETEPACLALSPGEEWAWPNPNKLASKEHIGARLPAINLDRLEEQRPGLIRQELIDWHFACAQANFAHQRLRDITMHEQPLETAVPPFLWELAQIASHEQRNIELAQCQAILDRIMTMVHGPSNLLEFYSQLWYDFYAMFGPLHSGTGDPSTEPYLSDTLAHVVTCPGSTPAQADQAKTINILREWFIGSEPQAPLENIDAADLPILMEPWAYVLQERDPKLLHAFLEKYQIPKESLALLGQLRDERDEHLLWPDSGYELLVNVFVLTQQGRANIFSPVQRALIEELYKKLPNGLENIRSTWDALDMAFPERSQ